MGASGNRQICACYGWPGSNQSILLRLVASAPPHAGQVREGEAPSYFNAVEAAVLVELVEGLLASAQQAGVRGVRPDDLGVMATYRKQVGCPQTSAPETRL